MNERECAENCPSGCYVCSFISKCKQIDRVSNSNGGFECSVIRTQWLKDNPIDSGWQELKIDDLSECPDLLVKNEYDFEGSVTGENFWYFDDIDGFRAIALLDDNHDIRYRKRQKKKPSHEELAKGYIKNTFPTTNEAINFPAAYSLLKSKRRIAFMAFIAGRESTIPPDNQN